MTRKQASARTGKTNGRKPPPASGTEGQTEMAQAAARALGAAAQDRPGFRISEAEVRESMAAVLEVISGKADARRERELIGPLYRAQMVLQAIVRGEVSLGHKAPAAAGPAIPLETVPDGPAQ